MITLKDIKNYARWYPGRLKVYAVLLALSLLFLAVCHIRKEPKVWNLRGKIVELTVHLQGVPYKYGGDDLEGFDCSGLVYYVYDAFGIELPRTARKQSKLKQKVSLKKVKPADILVFKLKRQWHTAIYTGGQTFIHAPNQRGLVRREHLNKFWKKRLKSIIHIIDE
ncbi:MAG: C40 family peptidase [bacterium]|nr:C40 family peptidase [bacterium]